MNKLDKYCNLIGHRHHSVNLHIKEGNRCCSGTDSFISTKFYLLSSNWSNERLILPFNWSVVSDITVTSLYHLTSRHAHLHIGAKPTGAEQIVLFSNWVKLSLLIRLIWRAWNLTALKLHWHCTGIAPSIYFGQSPFVLRGIVTLKLKWNCWRFE